jgi:hypothetical protein
MNHWLIDRGDLSGRPSVNLVILSFVNPLDLLDQTASATTGAFRVRQHDFRDRQYFTSHGIRVMVSIGGITYRLEYRARQDGGLGLRAAGLATARRRGRDRLRGEHGRIFRAAGLHRHVSRGASLRCDRKRPDPPHDRSGRRGSLADRARAGDHRLASHRHPVLDYANAMVPAGSRARPVPLRTGRSTSTARRSTPRQFLRSRQPLTGSLYVAEARGSGGCNAFAARCEGDGRLRPDGAEARGDERRRLHVLAAEAVTPVPRRSRRTPVRREWA